MCLFGYTLVYKLVNLKNVTICQVQFYMTVEEVSEDVRHTTQHHSQVSVWKVLQLAVIIKHSLKKSSASSWILDIGYIHLSIESHAYWKLSDALGKGLRKKYIKDVYLNSNTILSLNFQQKMYFTKLCFLGKHCTQSFLL